MDCKFEKVLSYLKAVLSNLSKFELFCKTKGHQIWDQRCLIWVLLGCSFEKLLSYLKSAFLNLLKCKMFWITKKALNIGNKKVLFGYFWVAAWKTIVIFETSTPEFVKTQRFIQNKIILNSDLKMPYLCIFGLGF